MINSTHWPKTTSDTMWVYKRYTLTLAMEHVVKITTDEFA